MDFIKLLILLVVICSLSTFSAKARNINISIYEAEAVPKLTDSQGYLLIYVDVEGVAPSIEFSKFRTSKTDFLLPDHKLLFKNNYFLDLKGIKKGFYFIPMLPGIYQITRINAPFYDLPYWLPTENQSKWRFAIEKGHINFIGELKIEKERGTRVINVNLFNRFATYYVDITKEIKRLDGLFPLKNKAGYRDDFVIRLEE